jgi:hypothetical protein
MLSSICSVSASPKPRRRAICPPQAGDRDSENASGVEYRSSHAWLYRSGLVRLAVEQIALVGSRRARCGGSPLTLPNAARISLRSVQYERGVWPVIVVRLLYRCAVHRMMRGRRHGPGSSAIQASLDCIKVLRTIDKPAFQRSLPQLNSGFPRAD